MAKEITITTDGTINSTKLIVDGKEITTDNKVVNISLYASAPYKSAYSGDIYKGGVSVDYTTVDDNGVMQRQALGSSDTNYVKGIGEKIKQDDQVICFVGAKVDAEIQTIVDKIVDHCTKEKLPCKSKEELSIRTIESLKDTVEDLGINLEE